MIDICYKVNNNTPVATVIQQLLETEYVTSFIQELEAAGNSQSAIIGEVLQKSIEHHGELENYLGNI